MAEISAAAVKQLRELTDMPMMKCKEALTAANGDQAKAIEILKQEAGKVMLKRAENVTAEGRIFTRVKEDGSEAVMIEVQCESAPVAGGEDFAKFGEMLTKQLLEGPGAKTPDELLAQKAPDGSGKTLKEIYEGMVGTIREKIVVARMIKAQGPVGVYVHHDGKNAVLFQATGENSKADVLRDVAMHITALRPVVVNPEELDPAKVQAERDRLSAEAKKTGKPENVIEKMVEGQLKRFYKDDAGVLTYQDFAKDQAKSVSQALAEKGLKAKAFTRWVIGN